MSLPSADAYNIKLLLHEVRNDNRPAESVFLCWAHEFRRMDLAYRFDGDKIGASLARCAERFTRGMALEAARGIPGVK